MVRFSTIDFSFRLPFSSLCWFSFVLFFLKKKISSTKIKTKANRFLLVIFFCFTVFFFGFFLGVVIYCVATLGPLRAFRLLLFLLFFIVFFSAPAVARKRGKKNRTKKIKKIKTQTRTRFAFLFLRRPTK